MVETNKNLKWCPRVTCDRYVQAQKSCCFTRSVATCSCGQRMCFKCGGVEHPGVSCNNVGNAGLREYMANNDVVKCPNCGFGTEKIDGCNHMTCAKCQYDWCWVCKGKYRSGHFSELNIFGCPGDQFTDDTQCCNIFKKVFVLIAIPFILLFGPIVGLSVGCYQCWSYSARRREKMLVCLVFTFLQFPFALMLGSAAGLLAFALLLIPAYILQLYRLLNVVFR